MFHVVVRLLEVVEQLHVLVLFFENNASNMMKRNDGLLATLRASHASLLALEDASLIVSKQISLHPLVNRKGDHLRDGWEAGDWAVVGGIFPVSALEYQDRFCE